MIERMTRDRVFCDDFYREPLALATAADANVALVDIGALLTLPAIYFREFARGLPASLPIPALREAKTASCSH